MSNESQNSKKSLIENTYIIWTLAQAIPIFFCVNELFKLDTFPSVIITCSVIWIHFIGAIMSFYYLTKVWNWDVVWALLFSAPPLIYQLISNSSFAMISNSKQQKQYEEISRNFKSVLSENWQFITPKEMNIFSISYILNMLMSLYLINQNEARISEMNSTLLFKLICVFLLPFGMAILAFLIFWGVIGIFVKDQNKVNEAISTFERKLLAALITNIAIWVLIRIL